MRVQHVVCPIDFSALSSRALAQAMAIADWSGAAIVAVNVFTPPEILRIAFPQYAGAMLDRDARARLILDMETAVKTARERGIHVRVEIREGDAADEIAACARELAEPIIVMATHGRRGLQRLALGSVTEHVLRTAPCPVLTIHPSPAQGEMEPPRVFKRILCPVDFSDESLDAMRAALGLAQQMDGTVMLLHVMEWVTEHEAPFLLRLLAEHRQLAESESRVWLQQAVPDEMRAWCGAAEVRVAEKPYQEILRQAAQWTADLIVLGVRGRGAADMLVFGSTTNRVVREAACAVLTIPQTAGRQIDAGPVVVG
jgi:nucleotide-binding universal stress UspA family protein